MNWVGVALLMAAAVTGIAIWVLPRLRTRSPLTLAAWSLAGIAGALGMWLAWPQTPGVIWLGLGVASGIGNYLLNTNR